MEDRITEGETYLLDSVVFYAIKNRKAKFMIPAEKNEFDSNFFSFDNVMIDTGSSTISIPYPSAIDFDTFYEHYKTYRWEIGRSIGVGIHYKVSLTIRGDTNKAFIIRLSSMKPKKDPLTTQSLRFILTYDIVLKILQRDVFKESKYKSSKDILMEYKKFIEDNCDKIPSLKEKPKKELVLIGQEILKDFYVLQLDYVTLVLEKRNHFYYFRVRLVQEEYYDAYQKLEVEHKEIFDCFDEEHDKGDFYLVSPILNNLEDDF